MSLKSWLNDGWVKQHTPSAHEIKNLSGIADRDLVQSLLPGLSPDTRFTIAYNAALQCCSAALAASGSSVVQQRWRLQATVSAAKHIITASSSRYNSL